MMRLLLVAGSLPVPSARVVHRHGLLDYNSYKRLSWLFECTLVTEVDRYGYYYELKVDVFFLYG